MDESLVLPSENEIIFYPRSWFFSRKSGFLVPLLVFQTKEASAKLDSASLLYPCSTAGASRVPPPLCSIVDGQYLPVLDLHHEPASKLDQGEWHASDVVVLALALAVANYLLIVLHIFSWKTQKAS